MAAESVLVTCLSPTTYLHQDSDRAVVYGFEQHGLPVAFASFSLPRSCQNAIVNVCPEGQYLGKRVLDVLLGNTYIPRSPDGEGQKRVLLRARGTTRCDEM